MKIGNGVTESWDYDTARLQPTSMTAGSLLTLGFGYGASASNNGNMLQQTIAITGMSTLPQVYRSVQTREACGVRASIKALGAMIEKDGG